MKRKHFCDNFLKTNDNLLFEFYAYKKSTKPSTLFNWLASILAATSIEIIKHNYIIGVGNSNIYLIDLGMHIFSPKNVKLRKIHILGKNSIKDLIIDKELLDI